MPMQLSEYDFQLPERLIARFPQKKRDESRLLVVDRKNQSFKATQFKNIIDYLNEGDCIVLNDSPVFPARLFGISQTRLRKHEFLLINYLEQNQWEVLINKSKKCKVSEIFDFEDTLTGEIKKKLPSGIHHVQFNRELQYQQLYKIGEMAIPPYILKLRGHIEKDKETYQTVFHSDINLNEIPVMGSIAAPTAGLHFTQDLLGKLKKKELY